MDVLPISDRTKPRHEYRNYRPRSRHWLGPIEAQKHYSTDVLVGVAVGNQPLLQLCGNALGDIDLAQLLGEWIQLATPDNAPANGLHPRGEKGRKSAATT